ncbi:hypothetical protein RUND412_006315 [Rhizina undulata]
MFRNLKSLLSFSRVPFRIAAKTPYIHRVRFVPPPKNFELKFRYTFPVLAGFSILGWAGTSGVLVENPIFIPLGPAWKMPQRKYGKDDPEMKSFQEFGRDHNKMVKCRKMLLEKLVKYFDATNREKMGEEIRTTASILYFGFPAGPPQEYMRPGLLLTADKPKPEEAEPRQLMPYAFTHVNYSWTTRPVEDTTVHRLSRLLYPSLTFNSLYASVRHSFSWFTAAVKGGSPIDSFDSAVSIGQEAVIEGIEVMKKEYRKGWKPPPPPRGHVIIYGMVEVKGDNLVVGVDVAASFDPESMEDWKFLKMELKFVGRLAKKPALPKPPPIVIPQKREMATQVVSGLKADIASMSAAALKKEVEVKKEQLLEKSMGKSDSNEEHPKSVALEGKTGDVLEGKEQPEAVIDETQKGVYNSRPKEDDRGTVRGGVDESASSSK